MPELRDYPTAAMQAGALADLVAAELATAIRARGRATLAVPGGTTPGAFLTALSAAGIDWAKVDVLLTDERFVPETSDRSNTALLRRTLLQGRAAAARLTPLYAPADRPEDVLDALSTGVEQVLPLDVCVLGMGADMHVASLFPGADRLAEGLSADAAYVLPMRAPGAPEPRMTLTAPALTGARHLHLLIQGKDKLAAVEAASRVASPEEAPARLILGRDDLIIHYAERDPS